MPYHVSFKGCEAELTGNCVDNGDVAPKVELIDADLATVAIAKEGAWLLMSLPSVDIAACAIQTRNLNVRCAVLENVRVAVISADLPFALKRFAFAEEIERLALLSDFREKAFAKSYGVLVEGGALAGLLALSVFVINGEGRVVHKQIVRDLGGEPDYDTALLVATSASRAKDFQ
ncbi:MAG: thiol peroxidase [Helicobacteraceae bacterium]|jgi:thiol peroxidase|nr:thiol peroxidase [Helicobacteraceae bacterium]